MQFFGYGYNINSVMMFIIPTYIVIIMDEQNFEKINDK